MYLPADDGLDRAIQKIVSSPHWTRHFLLFLQSSGYGKTRRCLKLLKERKGVYFQCGNNNIPDHFGRNVRVNTLMNINNNNESAMKNEVQRFLSDIYKKIKDADNGDALFDEQFPQNVYNTEFMKDVANQALFATGNENGTAAVQFVGQGSVDNCVAVSTENNASNANEMFVVIFDESHNLGENLIKHLKVALDDYNLIGIFVSTLGYIDKMLPPNRSSREIHRRFIAPVTFLNTFDLYRDNKFHLGRPLWKNRMEMGMSLEQLVYFAVSKLCGHINTHKEHTTLSLFMCRFGGLNPVDYCNASLFVTNCMATYVKLEVNYDYGNKDKKHVTCLVMYPSEPILVEASAYYTSSKNNFEHSMNRTALLAAVKNSINSKSIVEVHKEDVGELMACTLICFTLDTLRERSGTFYTAGCMSSSVKACDFLKSLYPSIEQENEMLSLVEEYVTNVTHFIRLPFTPKSNKIICDINKERGAAIITKEISPLVDFYLSFFKSSSTSSLSSELIHCRVQVKNVSQKISYHEAFTLLTAITGKCFPNEDNSNYIASEVCVNILINVGTGGLDPFAELYTSDNESVTKYILIALNLDHQICFKDLDYDLLEIVKDIAKYDQSINQENDEVIKQSLGQGYYESKKS